VALLASIGVGLAVIGPCLVMLYRLVLQERITPAYRPLGPRFRPASPGDRPAAR
jgi:hypothetical protein